MVNDEQFIPDEIVCPVGPLGEGLEFDIAEIEPLLDFLHSNQAASEQLVFQRGTVTAGQTLDCCKQALGPAGARLLTHALKGNDKIKSILFGTGSIANQGASYVADLLRENASIETVYLGCNLIAAKGMEVLADALESNPQVHALWLKRNPLGLGGARALAKLLGKNRNIRTLDLVNTGIGRVGLEAIVEALVQNDYPIERIYLSGNYLEGGSANTLSKLLLGNSHLRELYLSVNRLGDAGTVEIASALAKNQHLKVLSLASNGIGPASIEALCHALTNHESLQFLDLGYPRSTRVLGGSANCAGDTGAIHIANMVLLNESLLHLDIRRNGIGLHGLKCINDALRENHVLQELVHDSTRTVWLKQAIRDKLARNREGKQMPAIPDDVLAIKSVYR
ncbi:MAG: ribonuclease inhibitor [Bacteroidia bacterium]